MSADSFDGRVASKPVRDLLPELRAQRGWSRERLSHEAFSINQHGTSAAQIAAIERGVRHPSSETLAALAEAMGVEPEVFGEYRLALARSVIDERVVGLEEALENLEGSGMERLSKKAKPGRGRRGR